MKKECHFIPFYSTHEGRIDIQYCDLDAAETIIRGVRCTKREIPGMVAYKEDELDCRFYLWTPIGQHSVFERGLDMCRGVLGLPETRSSADLRKLFDKHRKR